MRNRLLTVISISVIAAFLIGMFIADSQPFLINKIKSFNKLLSSENTFEDPAEKYYVHVDPNSLIRLSTTQDVLDKRTKLIDYIWKEKGFPKSILPSVVETNITDPKYNDLDNLERIDKITVSMENDVNSIAYLFLAKQQNGKLVIYHEGHSGDFFNGINIIQFFLERDFSVIAFSMPLLGLNNQPIIEIENFGKIKLVSHDQFYLIETPQFSPIKYFLEPLALSLNYIDQKYNFNSYYMVGLSGGGWTTILYSAIDDRISQSYSVAGSLPIYLRYSERNIGDYEQINPQLYTISNYLELYILAAFGDDRKLIQIFNIYDPCCFAGTESKTYENAIQTKLAMLQKGTFEIRLDDTHREHKISDHALKIIINYIQQS